MSKIFIVFQFITRYQYFAIIANSRQAMPDTIDTATVGFRPKAHQEQHGTQHIIHPELTNQVLVWQLYHHARLVATVGRHNGRDTEDRLRQDKGGREGHAAGRSALDDVNGHGVCEREGRAWEARIAAVDRRWMEPEE